MPKHKVDYKSREKQVEHLEIMSSDLYSMFLRDSYYQNKPMVEIESLIKSSYDSYVAMEKLSLWNPPADDERMPTKEELDALPVPDWVLTLDDARSILMTEEGYAEYLASTAQ